MYLVNQLETNRYLKSVINISIRQKTVNVYSKLKKAPKGCLVYQKLSWLGKIFRLEIWLNHIKIGNHIKCIDSKAMMQSKLMSFLPQD